MIEQVKNFLVQLQVEKDSEEGKLYNHYLKPKEWIK